MNTVVRWTEKMSFIGEGSTASGSVQIKMDTSPPMGKGDALTPKQLLLASISGCSGMDIVALLKKFRQDMKSLSIEAEAKLTEGSYPPTYPAIFKNVDLNVRVEGDVIPEKALEATQLSMTKFCGVSAMVSNVVPIHYIVYVNGVLAGEGDAKFDNLPV
jgi:putative redox protein